jgi:hypothetical protein
MFQRLTCCWGRNHVSLSSEITSTKEDVSLELPRAVFSAPGEKLPEINANNTAKGKQSKGEKNRDPLSPFPSNQA